MLTIILLYTAAFCLTALILSEEENIKTKEIICCSVLWPLTLILFIALSFIRFCDRQFDRE